ncbi:unnamed protein product [Boreogadus saida]
MFDVPLTLNFNLCRSVNVNLLSMKTKKQVSTYLTGKILRAYGVYGLCAEARMCVGCSGPGRMCPAEGTNNRTIAVDHVCTRRNKDLCRLGSITNKTPLLGWNSGGGLLRHAVPPTPGPS